MTILEASTRALALVGLTSILATSLACGSGGGSDDEVGGSATDGDDAQETSADTGTDDATSETAETTETTETMTEDTGGALCEPPQDDEPAGPVATITVRNDSAALRYVAAMPGQCTWDAVRLSIDGEAVVTATNPIPCDENSCTWLCDDSMGTLYVLTPGSSFKLGWDGTIWVREPLSAACQEQFFCEELNSAYESCDVRRNVGSVEYSAGISVSDDCPANLPAEDCECAEGVCTMIYSGDVSVTDTLSATFPAGVEFVLD